MNEKSRRIGKLKGCLITLLVLGVLVFVVVPYGLRTYLRSRMDSDQLAMIERAHKPPQFPALWAQVEPLTPETQKALTVLGDAWRKRTGEGKPLAVAPGEAPIDRRDLNFISKTFAKLVKESPLSATDRAAAATLVKQDAEFIAAARVIAARPDYSTGATTDIGGVGGINFLGHRTAAELALISARLDALDGETSRGLATATSVLELSRRHPASTLISQLIAIAINRMATRTIADIAVQCDDTGALRTTLAEMKRLDAEVNVPLPDDLFLIDILGDLRTLKREGYPVDLDFSKPATYLYEQHIDAAVGYPEWKMQQLSPTDPLRAKYAKMLEERTPQLRQINIFTLSKVPGPYGDIARDRLMSSAPNFQETSIRATVTAAWFYLTELALAERIAKLEGGTATSSPCDLVPKYLATEPLDPFTSASFPRSPTGGFYSLGPDKRDDQGAITYDATNGTISSGDIVMRAP